MLLKIFQPIHAYNGVFSCRFTKSRMYNFYENKPKHSCSTSAEEQHLWSRSMQLHNLSLSLEKQNITLSYVTLGGKSYWINPAFANLTKNL